MWGATSFAQHLHGGDVATFALAQVTGTIAADFPLIVYADGVGSVVADDVVDAVAQELDSAAFDEFTSFLVHKVVAGHTIHLL
jgi:hypothetical protein